MNKITPADISDPQEVIGRAKALTLNEALAYAASLERVRMGAAKLG